LNEIINSKDNTPKTDDNIKNISKKLEYSSSSSASSLSSPINKKKTKNSIQKKEEKTTKSSSISTNNKTKSKLYDNDFDIPSSD
jgi:hypothetical protein